MTLPQRVAHIVKHGMAVLHPCVYGELGSKGAVDEIVKDIEREISLIMPGADAAGLARRFADSLPEVRKLVETDIDAAYALHSEMGCVLRRNEALGIYFITDPDGQLIEITPER